MPVVQKLCEIQNLVLRVVVRDQGDAGPACSARQRKETEMKLTNYERETIIVFNDAEDAAEVYTANAAWIRRLD